MFSGEGLTCVRGDRLVFAEIGFSVAPGQALLLRGPNGAGKTSLLRLMAGLIRPAAGRILWHGTPVSEAPEAHAARIAHVGHLDAVKSGLTVSDNLALWASLRPRDPDGPGEGRIAQALAAFGLAPLAPLPARLLSAGQRRRVALARLLLSAAPLWLIDEPTVALDPAGVAAFGAVLARHRAAGGMAVISTNVEIPAGDAATLALRPAPPGASGSG